MDPDAALAKLRGLLAEVVINEGRDPGEATVVAEVFEGLDQWLSRGGFLPQAWAARVVNLEQALALERENADRLDRELAGEKRYIRMLHKRLAKHEGWDAE